VSNDLSDFDLIPLFASSIISITAQGCFLQYLTYDYLEKTGKYFIQIKQENEFYLNELNTISKNMQSFMQDLPNTVNGHTVIPRVVHTEIDFKKKILPFFYWILEFHGPLKFGMNTYESVMNNEILEYDVHSIYLFDTLLQPVSVQSTLHHKILFAERIIKYWAYKGETVGPKELLMFKKIQ